MLDASPLKPARHDEVVKILDRVSYHNAAENPSETGDAQRRLAEAAGIIVADRWHMFQIRNAFREREQLLTEDDLMRHIIRAALAVVPDTAAAALREADARLADCERITRIGLTDTREMIARALA